MKTPLLALPLLVVAGAALSSGQDPERDEPQTRLEEHMHRIEDNVKALRRAIRSDDETPECLELVVALQADALVCKGETPSMAAKLPEAERAAFVTDFRREMATMMSRLLELEIALLDGELERARQIFDGIRQMKDTSHERFTEEE